LDKPLFRRRRVRQFLAWCVHFYTALGLVAAAGIAVLIVRGDGESFRAAFVLMLIATLIDATDGTLARAVRIKETLPGFDGRRLDDLVDFLNYTFLPLCLIWRAGLLPPGTEACLLLPLLASAYGFCQVSIKTDDGYFLGFPSYWNVIAFYLYALQPVPGWFSLSVVVLFALLTFVPTRYLYPTQRGRLNRWTNLLGAPWAGMLATALWVMPPRLPSPESPGDGLALRLALASLFFPAYYLAASWAVSWRLWHARPRRRRADKRNPPPSQREHREEKQNNEE
jgi:phosphatidylcholine synthase